MASWYFSQFVAYWYTLPVFLGLMFGGKIAKDGGIRLETCVLINEKCCVIMQYKQLKNLPILKIVEYEFLGKNTHIYHFLHDLQHLSLI